MLAKKGICRRDGCFEKNNVLLRGVGTYLMISVLSQTCCTSAQASLSMDLATILPNAPSQMDCIGLHIPTIDDAK